MPSSTERNLHPVNLPEGWAPESWRSRPAKQLPTYPDQAALAQVIRDAGWRDVAYRNLSFGIVALHRAFAPHPS